MSQGGLSIPPDPQQGLGNRYAGVPRPRKVSRGVSCVLLRKERPIARAWLTTTISLSPPLQVILIVVGLSCMLNLILVVVVLVRPVPNYSTSALFTIKSAQAASLTRRGFPLSSDSSVSEDLQSEQVNHIHRLRAPASSAAPNLAHPVLSRQRRRKRSDYWISAGVGLQCHVDDEQAVLLCQHWDDTCGCWTSQRVLSILYTQTLRLKPALTSESDPPPTYPTSIQPPGPQSPSIDTPALTRSDLGPSFSSSLSPTAPTASSSYETPTEPTLTSVKSNSKELTLSVTRTRSSAPTTTSNIASDGDGDTVPGAFYALVVSIWTIHES